MRLHLTLRVTVDAMNSLGAPTEDTIEAVHRELNDPRASGALFGEQFPNIFGGELPRSLSHPRSYVCLQWRLGIVLTSTLLKKKRSDRNTAQNTERNAECCHAALKVKCCRMTRQLQYLLQYQEIFLLILHQSDHTTTFRESTQSESDDFGLSSDLCRHQF